MQSTTNFLVGWKTELGSYNKGRYAINETKMSKLMPILCLTSTRILVRNSL